MISDGYFESNNLALRPRIGGTADGRNWWDVHDKRQTGDKTALVVNCTEPIAPERREPIAMNHIKSSSCGFEVAVVLKTFNHMFEQHVG